MYDEDELELGLGASSRRPPGDGASDAESAGSGADSDSDHVDPETLIEQAYLHDPNRDANTRRGKPRVELRRLTSWQTSKSNGGRSCWSGR